MKNLFFILCNMLYLYGLNISKPKYYEKIFILYHGYDIG